MPSSLATTATGFGHADAEVDDGVRLQFHGGTTGDDLALVHLQGRDGIGGDADVAVAGGAHGRVGFRHVFRRRHNDDGVHVDAGNLDQTGIKSTGLDHTFDLHDDLAAGALGRLGDGTGVEGHASFFKGNIALFVGGGAAEEADVDREGLVQKLFLAVDDELLHGIFLSLGRGVDGAAVNVGVDEGLQPHMGQSAHLAGRNVAEHVADGALRQVIARSFLQWRACPDRERGSSDRR